MPNGITPITPEIHYKVRTTYGRDWLSLNTNPYSYEILSTSVRRSPSVRDVLTFRTSARTKLSTSALHQVLRTHVLNLNHVTHLALVPWFDLFHLAYQFLQVLP